MSRTVIRIIKVRMSICFATFNECDRAHVCRLQRALGWRRWKYVRKEEKKTIKNSCTDAKSYVDRGSGEPPTRPTLLQSPGQ